MDYFTYEATEELISKKPRTEKHTINSSFLVSEAQMGYILDFFESHGKESFVYFSKQQEDKANNSTIYATSVGVVLVDDSPNKVQLWYAENMEEEIVSSGKNNSQINYDISEEGTIRFAIKYVEEADYLKITYSDESYLKVYIQNNYLIGDYRAKDQACLVKIPVGNIWTSPSLFKTPVISFTLSWNADNNVYLAHNNQVLKFSACKSLKDTNIETLQDTYDIIILDTFLSNITKHFDYPFEDFTNVVVDNFEVIVNEYPYYLKGRLGYLVNFGVNCINFTKINDNKYLAEKVLFLEV